MPDRPRSASGRTLGELFSEFSSEHSRGDRWQPAVDVFETGEAFVVRAEIPGLASEDLRVKLDGGRVRISGVRRVPSRDEVRTVHRMEIAFGAFEREVTIPIPFDRERVTAHLEDGFLEVRLPRRVPTRKRVEVETDQ